MFFDEADCLFGKVLVSFLRQLRDGYVNRSEIPFPASIALVGMLDVRDYKAQIRPDGESLGQISPFNIITEDLGLRNFTTEEVRNLFSQHTEATGQGFSPEALAAVMDWTRGQPWLVNAIARECVEKIHDFRYDEPITVAEIIGRYLTRDAQDNMLKSVATTPWATTDGLDMPGLMAAFQTFWRENAGADRHVYDYKEATPHLVLMAFLQRVLNGEGRITREMALGSRRLDLCIEYRHSRYAVEVKTAKNFAGEKSYAQLADYLDSLGQTEGWMAVFDTGSDKPWDEKLYNRDVAFAGKTLHIVGL